MPLICIRCTCIMFENLSTKNYTLQGRFKQSKSRAKIKWRIWKERQSECEKIYFFLFLCFILPIYATFRWRPMFPFFLPGDYAKNYVHLKKKKKVSLFFFAFLKPNCHQYTQNIFYRSGYRDVLQMGKYILNISRNSWYSW